MKKLLLMLITAGLLAACATTPATTEITLEANAMQFAPASIEVMAGQPVKLTFHNADVVDHDFSIMEIPIMSMNSTQEPMTGHAMGQMTTDPELHVAAMMGKTSTLEFTPTKPGTYEFFCTVAGHKEAGMMGTLVVKAP